MFQYGGTEKFGLRRDVLIPEKLLTDQMGLVLMDGSSPRGYRVNPGSCMGAVKGESPVARACGGGRMNSLPFAPQQVH